ncbi:sorting nexin-29-like [Argonauta hians]
MTDSDTHLAERQSLLTRLLDAVKQCQVRFGGRRELATDGDSRVSCLCAAWEAVLQYGLRYSNKALSALQQVSEITGLRKVTRFEPYPAFWHNIKEHLTKHEVERFLLLKSITTDMGRGRAWLRASLNERSLERYMHMIIEKDDILSQYYEDWAFLRDQERSNMLPNMAAGLGSILFALIIDNPEINSTPNSGTVQADTTEKVKPETKEDIQPIIVTNKPSVWEKKRERKKKKKLPNIVTFSDDDDPISSISCSPCSTQNDSFDLPSRSTLDSPSYLANTDSAVTDPESTEKSSPKSSVSNSNSNSSSSNNNNSNNSSSNSSSSSSSKNLQNSSTDSKSKAVTPYGSDEAGTKFKFNRKHLLRASDSQSSFMSDDAGGEDNFLAPVSSIHRRLSQGSGSSLEIEGSYCKDFLIPVTSAGDAPSGTKPESRSSLNDDGGGGYRPYSNSDVACAAYALTQAQKNNNNNKNSSSYSNINTNCQTFRTEGDGGNVEQDSHNEMTTSELKKAIVTMMVRKDQVEEQNRMLQQLLSQEKESGVCMRAEVNDLEKKMTVLQEKDSNKIQTLQKENDLLRHQLKKYVNAVQLLRKEGSNAEASLGIHLDDIQPVIPPPKSSIDYSHEASEYEKKLIQVAEMHGELIEFNEALHRTIQVKDSLIKRLKQELTSLHGPLPDEASSYNDSLSSQLDNVAITPKNLVHVWIPSAFLHGLSSDVHHVYQVYIRIQDEEWNVYRRYRQFYLLYSSLKKKHPIIGRFNFPPKVRVGYKEPRVVELRRTRFQAFLRKVISCVIENSSDIPGPITKQTVLQYLPFFGESTNEKPGKTKQPAPAPQGQAGAAPSSSNMSSPNPSAPDQPLYTGL